VRSVPAGPGTDGGADRQILRRAAESNRRAWDHWAALGSISSRPARNLSEGSARDLVDPDGWLPWGEVQRVLCLGGGGGQQGPAYARLGRSVTVLDVSAAQLDLDREVAAQEGLDLTCVQADMSEVGHLGLGSFDLVHQPISSCYVDDPAVVHTGIAAVLRPRGIYRGEHWNPVHMRLWQGGVGGATYQIPVPESLSAPLVAAVATGPGGEVLVETWTYPHSLTELLGSLCDAGFVIRRFAEDRGGDAGAEPGSEAHLAALVPPFFRLMARRLA
jgi:SAM-dependent methyltransferase